MSDFLANMAKLAGGGLNFSSRSSSNSAVSSNVNAFVQNVIGGEGSPQSGGGAVTTPSYVDSTSPISTPSYFPGDNNPAAGYVPPDYTEDEERRTNYLMIGGAILAAGAAVYYLA